MVYMVWVCEEASRIDQNRIVKRRNCLLLGGLPAVKTLFRIARLCSQFPHGNNRRLPSPAERLANSNQGATSPKVS
jgi:hypothetical protein